MKIYKQVLGVLVVSVFIVPQITLAAWWNPISWSIWNIFKPTPHVQIQTATTTPATPTTTTTQNIINQKVIQKIKTETPPKKSIQNQPATTKENSISRTPTVPAPLVTTWSELENQYFAEATQKGGTSLTITNAGEQRFYRSENGIWIRKNTSAEAQQPYQPPLPRPSAAQLTGIASLCSLAASKGNTYLIQVCTDGTLLNGYNTNVIFRSRIDAMVQEYQQQIAAQQAASDQKFNCMKNLAHPYDPSISAAANLYDSQVIQYACGLGPYPTAPDNTASQPQQTQQNTPMYILPTSPTQLKCTTQPWWDAGVLKFSTNCNSTNY